MTIGDVLATVTFLAGAGASWWALIVCTALICHQRTIPARAALEERPWRTLVSGVVVLAVGAALAALLANLPNGVLKLLAWLVMGAVLAIGAIGAGGLALALSERLQRFSPDLSPLSRLCRAAGLLVGAQFVPLFGWFLLLPLTLVLSLGMGFRSLRPSRAKKPALAEDVSPVPTAINLPISSPEFAPSAPLIVPMSHPIGHAEPLSPAEAQR